MLSSHTTPPLPLPLLVWAALCLAAAPASAQPRSASGAAFGGGAGVAGARADALSAPSAPSASAASSAAAAAPTRSTAQWLARLRQASRAPAFTGTYVVWSAPGTLASSRIWHASQGDVEVERVDALSGEPRSTYRAVGGRGNAVETFLYAQRVLRIDRRDTPGESSFPHLPSAGQGVSPVDHYDARQTGQERVAGFMADVVQVVPRDSLRYGYRVWSDQRTGLALKLQTLDERGRVLEQAAFSGLTFDAQINVDALLREMRHWRGWRVERVSRASTTAMAEGWQIGGPAGQPAPGFALQHCYRQPALASPAGTQARSGNTLASNVAVDVASGAVSGAASGHSAAQAWPQGAQDRPPDGAARPRWFQCVFSDGLAAVSVFIEPYDATQHAGDSEGAQEAALGATHLLARRVGDTGWVTIMGEVPPRTLKRFVAEVSQLP